MAYILPYPAILENDTNHIYKINRNFQDIKQKFSTTPQGLLELDKTLTISLSKFKNFRADDGGSDYTVNTGSMIRKARPYPPVNPFPGSSYAHNVIPNNCIITKIYAYGWGQGGTYSVASLSLRRVDASENVQIMATLGAANGGISGYQETSTTTISYPIIDLSNYRYYLRVYFSTSVIPNRSMWTADSVKVTGVKIAFSYLT